MKDKQPGGGEKGTRDADGQAQRSLSEKQERWRESEDDRHPALCVGHKQEDYSSK